jgi:hypothetical protein
MATSKAPHSRAARRQSVSVAAVAPRSRASKRVSTKKSRRSTSSTTTKPKPLPDNLPTAARAPTLSVGSVRAAETKLSLEISKLAKGRPRLRAASPPTWARTASGLGGLAHYLPTNRFEWWHADVPVTGAVRASELKDPAPDPQRALHREFYSTLASVAGTRLDEIDPVPLAKKLSWERLADANALPGAEFVVRRSPGASLPTLSVIALDRGGARQSWTVLAHRENAPDGSVIVSIVLDFFAPQRAVGVEAGFLSAVQRGLGAEFFELVARRADGSQIAIGTGDDLKPGLLWDANTVNTIGVRDSASEISSVELRFTEVGALQPGDVLFVARVWHEEFPVAAVYQGTLFTGDEAVFREFQHARHPDLTNGRLHQRSVTLRLPFRCRAVEVFLRGFKLSRQVEEAVEVQRLNGGVYRVVNGDQVTISMSAQFEKAVSRDDGQLVTAIYFSVLAWDPARADLAATGQPMSAEHGQGFAYTSEVTNFHPEAVSGVAASPEERCGPLFAGLSGFQFLFNESREPQFLAMGVGAMGGSWEGAAPEVNSNWDDAIQTVGGLGLMMVAGLGGILFLSSGLGATQPLTVDSPPLAYTEGGRKIRVGFGSLVGSTIDADETFFSRATPVILNGRSLRLPREEGITLSIPSRVQRLLERDAFLAGGIDARLEADIALTVLGKMILNPEDEIREIDVEVRGKNFDGQLVESQVGGGIDLRPSTDDGRFVFGLPVAAGIVRKTASLSLVFTMQALEFSAQVGTIATRPAQLGVLRNDSNVPLVVRAAELIEPDVGAGGLLALGGHVLGLRLTLRGETYALDEVATRGPFIMAPGESLVASGRFWAADVGLDGREAAIEFLTSAPGKERVLLPVSLRITPADARATFVPELINFGYVALGLGGTRPQAPRSRYALLTSDGTTPVLVTSVEFVPPVAGLSVGVIGDAPPGAPRTEPTVIGVDVLYQIDPGYSLHLALMFWPEDSGAFDTTLRLTTNVGVLTARVRGEAVRG